MPEAGRMAEFAHKRHTGESPTELDIMEDAFHKGWLGRVGGPFFLFERAMRLHAPDVWEEKKRWA